MNYLKQGATETSSPTIDARANLGIGALMSRFYCSVLTPNTTLVHPGMIASDEKNPARRPVFSTEVQISVAVAAATTASTTTEAAGTRFHRAGFVDHHVTATD